MAQVLVMAEVAAPTDELWQLVGRFDRFGDWHPLVAYCEARSGSKGAVRRSRLVGGGTIEERLEHVSDEERVCLVLSCLEPAADRQLGRRDPGSAAQRRRVLHRMVLQLHAARGPRGRWGEGNTGLLPGWA